METRCPKRILGTGLEGETDMGPCVVQCAACLVIGGKFICREYGKEVKPDTLREGS